MVLAPHGNNDAASEKQERQIGYWSGLSYAKLQEKSDKRSAETLTSEEEGKKRQLGYWSGMAHAKINQNHDDNKRSMDSSPNVEEGEFVFPNGNFFPETPGST